LRRRGALRILFESMPGRFPSTLRVLPACCVLAVGLAFAAEGGPPPPADDPAPPSELLLSRQLAEAEGLAVDDVVEMSTKVSGGATRRFRIAGIYEPIPDPFRLTQKRYEARLHLSDLIDLVADPNDPHTAEEVGRINIALEDPSEASDFARALNRKFPMVRARSTADAPESKLFLSLERFHVAVALVTVMGSAAFLLALMVMRADQRKETAGILRLIGVSRPRILLEVFIEGTFIALGGALFGVLLAAALEGLCNAFFQWHYDTALIFVRVTPGIGLRCIAIAVPLGILAGLVASWTLLRREILELLRR
jgi:putative ABC transport system permease protein